jgi:hypothetical protein
MKYPNNNRPVLLVTIVMFTACITIPSTDPIGNQDYSPNFTKK